MNTKNFRLFPVTDEQKSWGLYLTNCGYETVDPGCKKYPLPNTPSAYQFDWKKGRVVSDYSIVYVEKGRGIYESEREQTRTLEAGDAWWTFPGLRDRYRPDVETGWRVYWVAFQGEMIQRAFQRFFTEEDTVLHLHKPLEFELEIKELVEEVLKSPMEYPFSAGARILLLAGRLLELKETPKEGNQHSYSIRKAQSYILNHAFETIDYPKLCRQLGYSESTLRRSFLKVTQMTPLQFQLSIRLKHACEMLAGSDLAIGEIGQKVGIPDCNYFSRVFTNHLGCSPKKYRLQDNNRPNNPET